MSKYIEDLHARNADLVTITVKYEGEDTNNTRMVRRCDLEIYAPGTVWLSSKGGPAFTVVNHIGAA